MVVAPFASFGSASGSDWGIFVALGVFQMGLGLALLTVGARLLPPAEVALLSLLEVVLGPLWVWLAYSERPTTATLVGGAVITAAIVVQATASDDAPVAVPERAPAAAARVRLIELAARELGAIARGLEAGHDLLAVIALDLDRVPLDRAAGAAMPLEVARDAGEVAVETAHDGHRLAASAALLAEDAHDAVLRQRRPGRRSRACVRASSRRRSPSSVE